MFFPVIDNYILQSVVRDALKKIIVLSGTVGFQIRCTLPELQFWKGKKPCHTFWQGFFPRCSWSSGKVQHIRNPTVPEKAINYVFQSAWFLSCQLRFKVDY